MDARRAKEHVQDTARAMFDIVKRSRDSWDRVNADTSKLLNPYQHILDDMKDAYRNILQDWRDV